MRRAELPIPTAIIQARMASSRLPGKVMKEICGEPMLAWVVNRTRQAINIGEILVATTMDPSDDVIASFCTSSGIPFFRGDPHDVLDRYYQAALKTNADPIVRITADCPMIDPFLIDQMLEMFISQKVDFIANRLPPPFHRTFPIGLDVEICSFQALERAWMLARESFEREHVMPYIYTHEDQFKIHVVNAERDYGSLRWTVDTPQDLEFAKKVFEHMQCRKDFSWHDILKLVQDHPELPEINVATPHKTLHDVDDRMMKKD